MPERDALRDHLAAVGTSNPVVLTGDVHANYVCDVKADFADPASATVATEIVGTSITTGGDGVDSNAGDVVQLAENPHIKFINRQRGYVRNVVTPTTWTADFQVVPYVTTPGAPLTTRADLRHRSGPGRRPPRLRRRAAHTTSRNVSPRTMRPIAPGSSRTARRATGRTRPPAYAWRIARTSSSVIGRSRPVTQ